MPEGRDGTITHMAVAIGTPLPAFALTDPATGKSFGTSDLIGADAMVVFLRGTWCPYCREQLALMKERYSEIEAAKIRVVAISCQSAASLARYLEGNPLPFPVLADESRGVARAFGVHYRFRWDGMNLAHPSLFIADRTGTITFKHVGRTMSDLPIGLLLDRFLGFLRESAPIAGGTA